MTVTALYRTRILSNVSFLQSKFLIVYIYVFGVVYGVCMYMCVFLCVREKERGKGREGDLSCVCMACMCVCSMCVEWCVCLYVGMRCVCACVWCVYVSVCACTCMSLLTLAFIVQTNRQCMIYDISSEFVMAEE